MKRSLFALLLLAGACGDPLGKGWLVERPRILGARASVDTDPARASVNPGETVNVDWLVAGPAGPPPLEWAFAACFTPEGTYPEPRCAEPFASGPGVGTRATITVPLDTHSARSILVLAVFCESGAPRLDARTFDASCTNGEALLATASVTIGGPNANPTIAEEALLFDGAPFPSANDCLLPDTEHTFAFRPNGSEREPEETLILSHVVTAGELDRQYSALEAGEPLRDLSVKWKTPAPDVAIGVDVFFILRDGRGGAAFERRTVCVRERNK